ncbi:response regulator transcription factor [Pseudomonas alkylphenolica]|uniref:LuxR family transcriptional regulator n=1 Tax=Pseudomonas alkylphenolica TaxID=237609 RepID=A0A077FC59_9PSED|nr:helix-turn-helix transcriptional regulator [Pseudomonas alkylphenolica]AIL60911.1 LuxR family transcriptional regulator [Pseudomonas alkylphenolica]
METITEGSWIGRLGLGLAPRELQCVLAVAQGMTAKEIAKLLGIAPGTVEKRLSAAMFKLDAPRRAALVAEAMKRQIISPLCIVLAGLMAMHAVMGDADPMRRDRRVPERRIAQVRIIRKAESFDLHA